MNKLWILSLEPIEQRYTKQWFDHLPNLFKSEGLDVEQINGDLGLLDITPGGFLNFAETNIWKSQQSIQLFNKINSGEIKDSDVILITDAWNPVVLMLKYIKDLLNKKFKIVQLWHAGSYINEDPLGQKFTDKRWSYSAETAMFYAADYNVFASDSHISQFCDVLSVHESDPSIIRSGFPMEYINDIDFPVVEKEYIIVFPHRISPEKQPEIFEELERLLPQYKFISCQKENMNKEQYHATLAKSKIMFSAALLETLGICQYEALAANCIPLVPDHLSYSEMYYEDSVCLYPSDSCNIKSVEYLKNRIIDMMENYDAYLDSVQADMYLQRENYFAATNLIQLLKRI